MHYFFKRYQDNKAICPNVLRLCSVSVVIAFIKGKEVDRFHSVQSHDFIRCFIDKNLAKFK